MGHALETTPATQREIKSAVADKSLLSIEGQFVDRIYNFVYRWLMDRFLLL
jgi:hypothetical protein